MNILIIGYGIVGKNMHKIFNDADIYDINPPFSKLRADKNYDVAFICVPTPPINSLNDMRCNWSIVGDVVEKFNPRVFCIRSTIPPGTTKYLQETHKKPCVFCPEYYGETIHANNYDYKFITLGGDSEYTKIIAEAFSEKFTADFEILQISSIEAETAKYMENCWLALKVSFCNEFKNICDMNGANYHNVRQAWLKDPRINPSHTWVYENKPGWQSKCFDKDIPALIAYAKEIGVNTPVIQSSLEYKRIY